MGPGEPVGPGGPAGPSTFHCTRVSFAWQSVPASTSRMFPLPGLMQASSTLDVLAARIAIGTINRSAARTIRQVTPARRTNVMLISIAF